MLIKLAVCIVAGLGAGIGHRAGGPFGRGGDFPHADHVFGVSGL